MPGGDGALRYPGPMIVTAAESEALARAVVALREGLLVAFPTETVYGLGANARDPAAVSHRLAGVLRAVSRPDVAQGLWR